MKRLLRASLHIDETFSPSMEVCRLKRTVARKQKPTRFLPKENHVEQIISLNEQTSNIFSKI
jgi:hypothetical protein